MTLQVSLFLPIEACVLVIDCLVILPMKVNKLPLMSQEFYWFIA